jgi:hypothetical protein
MESVRQESIRDRDMHSGKQPEVAQNGQNCQCKSEGPRCPSSYPPDTQILERDSTIFSRNQSPTTNSHSVITPAMNQKKKRCSGEPLTAAGTELVMSLEKDQISAGIPRPNVRDSTQHRNRPEGGVTDLTLTVCVAMTISLRRQSATKRAHVLSYTKPPR